MRHSSIVFAFSLALLAAFATQDAMAQRRWDEPPRLRLMQGPGRGLRPNGAPNGNNGEGPRRQGAGRGMAGLPPKWVENLRDMSPEEQERFLDNNRQFQNLPPERQAQIRNNLQKWNQLSPTERDAIRDREYMWEHMSPEQRQYVQGVLLPRWQQMPFERRQLINGRLHTLQSMTPAEREAALDDPRFMQGLSPDEQSMLRDLNSLRNPPNQ
ncbi:MAG: DUF3106 domain-containing protein [Candidatus Acidiferrales bacterium]